MTTIAELLQQEPKRVDPGVRMLVGSRYNHIPEIEDHYLYGTVYRDDFSPRITQVVFHEAVEDYRRSWIMFGVKLDDRWVMLCSNAGRELDDFSRRQIVDAEAYADMITYIRTELVRHGEIKPPEVVSLDTPVEFTFYGRDVRVSRAW